MGKEKKAIGEAYQVRLSDNALRNFDEITGYVAFLNHQPINAIKLGDAIFEAIDRIALHPFAFKECEELPTKGKIYRSALCFSWRIIFRMLNGEIVILGIIHSSRRPSKAKALRKIK